MIYRRFRRWSEAGVWEAVAMLAEIMATALIVPQFVLIFWQRAKGGSSTRSCPQYLKISRGGFTSRIHCLTYGRGRPLAFHLTVGEAVDYKT